MTEPRTRVPAMCGVAGVVGVLCAIVFIAATVSVATAGDSIRVQVATPMRRDIVRSFDTVASLEAQERVTVYSKVSGYLEAIAVDVGDVVDEGDVLATLEIPEFVSTIAKARAEAALERITLDRLVAIQKEEASAVTQQEVDAARARWNAARASEAELKTQEDYATIRAPFDGIVTERFVHRGALVTAGTESKPTAIVTLVNASTLRGVIEVPETDYRFAAVGNEARFTVDAFPDRAFTGKIARRAGALDPMTRTMRVEVAIDNAAGDLAPGMFARVHLELETRRDRVAIHPGWLHQRKQQAYVFVAEAGVARRIDIVIGADDGKVIEVAEGLDGTESVITMASSDLRDGAAITVTDAK